MKALVAAALKDWQDIRLKIQALEKENDQKFSVISDWSKLVIDSMFYVL
jgi:hypothetical protein